MRFTSSQKVELFACSLHNLPVAVEANEEWVNLLLMKSYLKAPLHSLKRPSIKKLKAIFEESEHDFF